MKILPISELISNFQTFESDYESENLRESIDFNVFNFIESVFWIDEPKHSRILAFLLDPNEIHGQKETFLHLFLERLGIKDFRQNHWNVYAEKGNVDILITSNYPDRKTIIIENKSNWAVDQDCQMYRYWYHHIFRNNNDISASFNTDNNRIIYLSPSEDKYYTSNSISRPDSGFENCIEMLDEKIINTWYFHIELKKWLFECAEKASSDRLKLFINDYIAFWEKTNNKEKTIMSELKNYFKDKEQDWKDFVEASKYIEKLKLSWIESFSDKLKSFCIPEWKFEKFQPDERYLPYDDFRWFVKDKDSLCFVYESKIGLTLWKSQFAEQKQKYKVEFETIFKDDFDFIPDNSNYIMKLNVDSIIEEDSEKFSWIVGNDPDEILNVVQRVLDKYMRKPETVQFFKQIDNQLI